MRNKQFIFILFLSTPLLANGLFTLLDNPIVRYMLATMIFLLLVIFYLLYRTSKQHRKHKAIIQKVHNETREAERAKDTFLANVSHETRTPMTAIIGLSHILLQSRLNQTQRLNISKIKRSAEHLLSITNDILDYSKIEAGKLEINHIPFETNTFFTKLADITSIQAVEKKLDLIFDISQQLPDTLIGDPLRISQVLINLINNSIKFTDKGHIVVRVRVLSSDGTSYKIRFEVNDSGIGLTQEQISKLFTAFDQADNKISRKYGGTGLGLAISQELVQKMGGELRVKSTFREGSTFYFTLDLKAKAGTQKAGDQHMRRLLNNKAILILESSGYTANMLADILTYYKANAKISSSMKVLCDQLKHREWDAILIDSRLVHKITDLELLNAKCDATVLLNYETLSDTSNMPIKFNAELNKPFTYQSLLLTMKEIFGKEIQQNSVAESETSLDDICVLEGSKILLAEDNEGNQMVVEGLLEGSGIEITTVVNGQKAVEAVFNRANHFELVLMDINMPIMDGYSATSIIREYQKYDNMPIIAMTANVTESDIEKSKSYGMQAHLSKPIDVKTFYKTLLQFIKPKISAENSSHKREKKAVVTSSVSLDSLPNIDVTDGLSRLNNNSVAYQNVLYKFADMFTNISSELSTAVSEQKFDEGRALAHNLKGLSGNIGAKEIYALAQELEESFKDGDGEFNALINAIEQKLIPLTQSIKLLQETQKSLEKPVEKSSLSSEEATKLLQRLHGFAKKRKAQDVKSVCKEIEAAQWPKEQQKSIDDIVISAQRYQFKDVCRIIENLKIEGLS